MTERRRSVRTFDGRRLSQEDLEKLTSFCDQAQNPYGIPVEYKVLDPKEHDLKSPVLNGETL